MIQTEAWVLHRRSAELLPGVHSELRLETIEVRKKNDSDALVEPILGCWEGNLTHALTGLPVDICKQRGEDRVVIGNCGLARVLDPGSNPRGLREGDLCLVFPSDPDRTRFGFMKDAYAYDAPGTVGLMAKRTYLNPLQLIPIPRDQDFTIEQWAAFSGRYVTAWPSWKLARMNFRALVSEEDYSQPHVWAWGGGVSIAQLELAKHFGFRCTMITSNERRGELIRKKGMSVLNRREFPDLRFDEKRFADDVAYRRAYLRSEKLFLRQVAERTEGQGVSIFFDHIGAPVTRATLKALGCPGVIATVGWKHGMETSTLRAVECMNWHIHLHSHFARPDDAVEAIQFAIDKKWMPTVVSKPYRWEDIPRLAKDYEAGMDCYFPMFQVNPLRP